MTVIPSIYQSIYKYLITLYLLVLSTTTYTTHPPPHHSSHHYVYVSGQQLSSDPKSCGALGYVCPIAANGIPKCVNGKCSIQCNQPYYISGGSQGGCIYDPLSVDTPSSGKVVSYTLTLSYIQQYPYTKPMISVNGQVPGK